MSLNSYREVTTLVNAHVTFKQVPGEVYSKIAIYSGQDGVEL